MMTKVIKYTFYGLVALAGIITIIEAIREAGATMTYVTKEDIKMKGARVFHVKVHIKKDEEIQQEESENNEKNI